MCADRFSRGGCPAAVVGSGVPPCVHEGSWVRGRGPGQLAWAPFPNTCPTEVQASTCPEYLASVHVSGTAVRCQPLGVLRPPREVPGGSRAQVPEASAILGLGRERSLSSRRCGAARGLGGSVPTEGMSRGGTVAQQAAVAAVPPALEPQCSSCLGQLCPGGAFASLTPGVSRRHGASDLSGPSCSSPQGRRD